MAEKITIAQYAAALHNAISESNPKDHDKVIDNFIRILKSNRDLEKYEKIVDEYEQLLIQENDTAKIEVTTTSQTEVSPALIKQLNKFAHQQRSTATKTNKPEITSKHDDSIIGGVLIKVDDTLIDASLKNQLDNLHSHLQN